MSISKKRLKALKNIKDSEIDDSDIPETNSKFWEDAITVKPRKKQLISIRLDSEVVEWFKNHHSKYQSAINNVLHAYMDAKNSTIKK